jgi:hypothetical protein
MELGGGALTLNLQASSPGALKMATNRRGTDRFGDAVIVCGLKNERRWSSPEPSAGGLMTPGRFKRPGVFCFRGTWLCGGKERHFAYRFVGGVRRSRNAGALRFAGAGAEPHGHGVSCRNAAGESDWLFFIGRHRRVWIDAPFLAARLAHRNNSGIFRRVYDVLDLQLGDRATAARRRVDSRQRLLAFERGRRNRSGSFWHAARGTHLGGRRWNTKNLKVNAR